MTKTLFVTPDFTSDEWQCRTLRTPNNAEWLGVFNKALLLMLDTWNWEQINATDLTVDDTITLVSSILDEFWATPDCGDGGGCLLPGIETPPFRLGADGHFQMLDPETGEWGAPTGEYEIPPTPEREEPTAYARRCAAAANAAHVMELLYEAITDEIALGGDTLQVAAAMVAALVTAVGGWIAAPVYAIIQLTIALFAGMIELLQVLGSDVWTEGFTEKLKCALLDCATDTGDVVTFDLSCIREQLSETPDLLNPNWFYELQLFAQVLFLMETITIDGLNAAGATTAIVDPDCSCGDWCFEVDLATTNGGFDVTSSAAFAGTYQSGLGWKAANKVIGGVQRTIVQGKFPFSASTHITDIGWRYDYTKGTNQNGVTAVGVYRSNFVETLFNRLMQAQPNGANQQENIVVDVDCTSLDFDIQCSHTAYGGAATLLAITIHGTGAKPTFLEAMGWVEC